MIVAAALAAALSAPALPAIAPLAANAPRYARLALTTYVYGIPGTGELLIDRQTGRFVRTFASGPTSEREGFDGTRAWLADATGMPRVQGNADQRGAILASSFIFAHGPQPAGVTRPLAVTPWGRRPFPSEVVVPVGEDRRTFVFDNYQSVGGLRMPFAFSETSNNGRWTANIARVEFPRTVPDAAFAPPPAPHDATLTGTTRLRIAAYNAIEVRVNGGPPLHFMVDTGGQNVITPEAAARLDLSVVGAGRVGGAGASSAAVRYAQVRSLRVGTAELRDQPFLVLELGASTPFDGIIGYELFARFAARLDLEGSTLELAASAAAFGPAGTAVPMTFDDRQPQVDGAIDGIAGAFTLDTGSAEAVDLNTPFVRAHDLVRRYHAGARTMLYAGVGGEVDGWLTRARELRLGTVTTHDVRLGLTDARAGVEIDPSTAGNVGDQVLRRFRIVFDYQHQLVRLDPKR